MSGTNQPTLLVTGASGHMGSRVVELLLEANVGNIIAASRTPEKLAHFAERGVTIRHADFDDPEGLVKAFTGVDRLLLISTDTVGAPGVRLQQHVNAVKAADKAGVKHVIYTSLTNPGPDSPVLLAPDHAGTEAALTESNLGWTVLRNNLYTENLIAAANQAIKVGKVFSAAGEGKAAYVTREDCSRAAAGALAANFEGRRTLDVSGPEALSQNDVAALASKISGQDIGYLPLSAEALIEGMVGGGLPRPIAELLTSFDTAIAEGKMAVVTNVVEELGGKKAISAAEFLAANRDAVLGTQPVASH